MNEKKIEIAIIFFVTHFFVVGEICEAKDVACMAIIPCTNLYTLIVEMALGLFHFQLYIGGGGTEYF